jgi:hypothetical protein
MLGKISRVFRFGLLPLVIAAVVTAGCGSPTASVAGKVTYDGKPVENGIITFSPTTGKGHPASAPIRDGSYKIDKIAPGEYYVNVGDGPAQTDGGSGPATDEDYAKYDKDRSKSYKRGKETVKQDEEQIPPEASVGKTANISSGSNTKDFDLPKVEPKPTKKGAKK